MFLKNKHKKKLSPSEILELKPGDDHYRAYVGPPRDYDLISAMVFNLLTCLGLQQNHKLLDIGCGSLRAGRLLIPYLAKGCYFGVEPNEWLVKEGIKNEVGKDQIRLKEPEFSYDTSMVGFRRPLELNFAFAQSIFSHCGIDLIENWLVELQPHLRHDGALLATFLIGEEDFTGSGWVYPDCVKFKVDSVAAIAEKHGYKLDMLNWAHPRQAWGLFSRKDYDFSLVRGGDVAWSRAVEARYPTP